VEISRTPICSHLKVLHPISRRVFIDVTTAADISCFSLWMCGLFL